MAAVSKHEGVTAALILRDARTPVRALRDLPAGALLRMRTAESAARRRTVFGHSHLTMSNSPDLLVPAARLRPGFCIVASLTRIEGWAERRETFGCSGTRSACHLASKTRVNALMTRHTRRLRGALRPMTRDARLSALHRGGFSPGAALPSPSAPAALQRRAVAFGSAQRAPRSQVVVPGGRLPGPPGASGYKPLPQDATPRSAFRIVSRIRPL